jgi:hypothetical protein
LISRQETGRREWLRERARELPSSREQLISKALPELLALPDAAPLSAILPELYHSDESVRRYVAASLAIFDGALLTKQLTPMVRKKGVTEELTRETSRDSKQQLDFSRPPSAWTIKIQVSKQTA